VLMIVEYDELMTGYLDDFGHLPVDLILDYDE